MRLYTSSTSPYARKVRMVAIEKGLALEEVAVTPPIAASPVAEHNPLGKIPTLVRADGRPLYDSRVIAQYLELLQPSPALLPSEADARVEVLRWEALADGVSDAAVLRMTEDRRAQPEAQQKQHQLRKIEAALTLAQAALSGRRYLVGDQLTLADLALVAACGYASLRGALDLSDGRWSVLANWLSVMHERPSVAATVPSVAATVPSVAVTVPSVAVTVPSVPQ
jgi:glutathione S-transferase